MVYIKKIRLFIFALTITLWADESISLQFRHLEGDVLHSSALVDESVYYNGYLNHRAEIDEFSVSTILEVLEDGDAVLDSSFRTVERLGGIPGMLEWVSSETVRIERDTKGSISVPEDSLRPVVRNIPRFPNYNVSPGDTWSYPAEEVHVFRFNNILAGPYRGPVQVLYKYVDNITRNDRLYAKISIDYSLYIPVRLRGEPIRLISGNSSQELLWDINNGRPEEKYEEFEFLMMMSDGNTQEFVGTGVTKYRLSKIIDRANATESLESQLRLVPGISIKPTEEGVLLSINETDRILFEPESSVVSHSQRYRLERLAESLEEYSDRDLLITGHTANYGTFEGRKTLSLDRASAVADILFPKGRSGPGRLFLRGKGNNEPKGTDQENRRVEILILD